MALKYRRTTGIVLRRTNFGEADRIVVVLTPEGKFGMVAKGARRLASKLAAGIEPMSENQLTLVEGKGELLTLISARLAEAWEGLLHDYDRLQLAYSMMKLIDTITEPQTGGDLYLPLKSALQALNQPEASSELTELWFYLQLLKSSGHQPELRHDEARAPLDEAGSYNLDPTRGLLVSSDKGSLASRHVKLWRLCLDHSLRAVMKVGGSDQAASQSIDNLRPFVQHIY